MWAELEGFNICSAMLVREGGWVGHSLVQFVCVCVVWTRMRYGHACGMDTHAVWTRMRYGHACGMDTHAGVPPAVSTQHHTACLLYSRKFNDTSPEVFIPNY